LLSAALPLFKRLAENVTEWWQFVR